LPEGRKKKERHLQGEKSSVNYFHNKINRSTKKRKKEGEKTSSSGMIASRPDPSGKGRKKKRKEPNHGKKKVKK